MAGTHEGGRKAAITNKQRYGDTFYKIMGRKGGTISRGGGFAANPALASEAGRKGGKASRRPKKAMEFIHDHIPATAQEQQRAIHQATVKIGSTLAQTIARLQRVAEAAAERRSSDTPKHP